MWFLVYAVKLFQFFVVKCNYTVNQSSCRRQFLVSKTWDIDGGYSDSQNLREKIYSGPGGTQNSQFLIYYDTVKKLADISSNICIVLKCPQPILAQCYITYRNQSFDLVSKSNDWFLCEMYHWVEMGKLIHTRMCLSFVFNLFSANPTKWSNTPKQFVSYCRRTVWVCLTILWGWRLKG